MFKVSQKTEYALRALTELALRTSERTVPARELSSAQGIPLRFLEQQLSTLHKAGLVESFRGAGGGCRLSREPAQITVAEVVDVMEGPYYPMHCLEPHDHTCAQDERCGLQGLWGQVHAAVRVVFERTSLADLALEHRRLAPDNPIWSPADLLRQAERVERPS